MSTRNNERPGDFLPVRSSGSMNAAPPPSGRGSIGIATGRFGVDKVVCTDGTTLPCSNIAT